MSAAAFGAWSAGDVFVAATELNNADDDHAGRGRILQYDADLKLKGTLYIEQTTHLVGGLKFDEEGVLWAFDSQGFRVLNLHRDGRVVLRNEFGARAYSHVHFCRDGSLLFGEHVVGDAVRPEMQARMKTRIPFMPGTTRLGDGHVWRYSRDGKLLAEYQTATHGGMGGFLGVTMSALTPDERTLVYCSETGPRLMRYDLIGRQQLPDLQRFEPPFPPGPPPMFFGMQYAADGTLYVLRGASIEIVDDEGQTQRSIALPGFGWALMDLMADGRQCLVSNFFTGEVARIDLASGEKQASVIAGQPKSVAGLAEYRG
ncbi:MAG: hypothetical protein ACO329_05240 [Steroidobacteraceae bacterium]